MYIINTKKYMNLPINIEELLSGQAIECNRLEYKTGWNPDSIYRTICAFANDFDETGGGYIVLGVKEVDGRAVRPVQGIEPEKIEHIEKEMVGYNNLMRPFYQPRLYVESVDGKNILVIKVSPGERRPYKVPDQITAKQKTYNYYIRYNSSSIVPKDEYERELINLANRTPFDDRGNDRIALEDISTLLLHDYLTKIKSSLANVLLTENLKMVLEQMELLEPEPEGRHIKNVAAMMFAERPDRFFPQAQVEIVLFPEGREKNPNNLIEVDPIRGSVPSIIEKTLSYLRTNVIKKKILKPNDDEHSLSFYNYPYQALEEAVVNSLYHRDWTIREPVEITIEPERITILNFSGPNHTIPMAAIKEGRTLRSRRYRNRRLGEFLKELNLTEGRATGIPTIQDELKNNGSPRATIETDEERSYFLIDIPCHPDFISEKVVLNKVFTKDFIKDFVKSNPSQLSERQIKILIMIAEDDTCTSQKISQKTGVSQRTVLKDMKEMQALNILAHEGGRKQGKWVIIIDN